MSLTAIMTLIKKELLQFFVTPISYVLIAMFSLINSYFFVMIFLFSHDVNLMSYLLGNMAFLLLFFCPIMSMRMMSEERFRGTEELLFTSPLRASELIWGKFISLGIIFTAMILVTVAYPIILMSLGKPDLGIILVGYLGVWLMGLSCLSVGMLCSSLTQRQVVSAILTFGVVLFSWVLGWVGETNISPLTQFASELSMLTHLKSFQKGIIDWWNVSYFVVAIIVPLEITAYYLHFQHYQTNRLRLLGRCIIAITIPFIIAYGINVTQLHRIDMTSNKQFSLSVSTEGIVQAIETPIDIKVFFLKDSYEGGILEGLLHRYHEINKAITVSFIDPDQEPLVAEKYNIDDYATLIIQKGNQQIRVTRQQLFHIQENTELFRGEHVITNALMRMTGNRVQTVGILTGHQERSIESKSVDGLSRLAKRLQDLNYQVQAINPSVEPVPRNIDSLIIPHPKESWSNAVLTRIARYINANKPVVILTDSTKTQEVNPILSDLNISAHPLLVIDEQLSYYLNPITIMPVMAEHPVTSALLADSQKVVFRGASVLTRSRKNNNRYSHTPLLRSSKQSWGESSQDPELIQYNKGSDAMGPFHLGMLIKHEDAERAHIAVYSDTDFISNEMLDLHGNADLFFNTLAYMMHNDQLSIRPKVSHIEEVALSKDTGRWILIVLFGLIPGSLAILGTWIWWKRKEW